MRYDILWVLNLDDGSFIENSDIVELKSLSNLRKIMENEVNGVTPAEEKRMLNFRTAVEASKGTLKKIKFYYPKSAIAINRQTYLRAVAYAKEHYKGLKYNGGDYHKLHITPIDNIIAELSNDDWLYLIVVQLHDLIEDTDVTYQDIYRRFGKTVADHVMELTHEGSKKDGHYFPRLESLLARRIKFADRLVNLFNVEGFSTKKMLRYLDKSVFWFTTPEEAKKFVKDYGAM